MLKTFPHKYDVSWSYACICQGATFYAELDIDLSSSWLCHWHSADDWSISPHPDPSVEP